MISIIYLKIMVEEQGSFCMATVALQVKHCFKLSLCFKLEVATSYPRPPDKRVCIGNLFSLFLIQNICCGYSKHSFKLMGKKIVTILHS